MLSCYQVAGSSMMMVYGRQFQKLLYYICHDYFHKIETVTLPGQGGPVMRLKMFLENCIKSGSVTPPVGLLTPNFWHT